MGSKVRSWFGQHYMGVLALFVALGGTAYAANTVGSNDVVNESLKSKDLKNAAAVKGEDVVDETLTGLDVANETLAGGDISEENVPRLFEQANSDDVNGYSDAAVSVLYMNTEDPAQSYPTTGFLGEGITFGTTGTPDQFDVCNESGFENVDIVIHNAGVRTVLNLDDGECSSPQTIQDDEEFIVFGLGTVTFGAYAGNTSIASEDEVYTLFTLANFDTND